MIVVVVAAMTAMVEGGDMVTVAAVASARHTRRTHLWSNAPRRKSLSLRASPITEIACYPLGPSPTKPVE